MTRHFLARLATQILVSIPLLACCWAWGGLRADWLYWVMPYATGFGVMAFFLPQCRPHESGSEAFSRMWRELLRDPLFYVALFFVGYLSLPLFNVGRPPVEVYKLGKLVGAAYPPECYPKWRFLPFCVSPAAHAVMFYWFVPALVSVLGVRHALTRSGARLNYEFLVWNTAALSLFGFVQIITQAQFPFWTAIERPVHFFSVFGYPNAAGSFFVLGLALSFGLWIEHMQWVEEQAILFADQRTGAGGRIRHPGLTAHIPLVAVALNFFAVLATLSRAALMLGAFLVGAFLFYITFRVFVCGGVERARRFRSLMVVGVAGLSLAGLVFVYAPPQVLSEIKTLNVFSVSDRVSGKGQYHTRVASSIMRDYPLFGVGGWGYPYFCDLYLSAGEIGQTQEKGGVNVHNDHLQFLAELGAVGFGCLVAIVAILLIPVIGFWRKLSREATAAARSSLGPSSLAVFSLPPPVLWGLLGVAMVFIHAFGDCPLRSSAVLTFAWVTLATLLGYVPRQKGPRES